MTDTPIVIATLARAALMMRMELDQSRTNIKHNGAAGTDREEILLPFLQAHLPGTVVAVDSGEVVSSEGTRSKQVDILIVDPATPPLYNGAGRTHRIVPCECVYGAVEVKTHLSVRELINACENIRSVKEQAKSAFRADVFGRQTTRYGKTWPYTPTTGVVFGFEGASINALGEAFAEWCKDVPFELRPDSVWVLGNGALSWTEPYNAQALSGFSDGGSLLRAVAPYEDQDVLLPMVMRLNMDFQNVFMPVFELEKYAAGKTLGVLGNTWAA